MSHGQWKLVHDIGMDEPHLYDLASDPGENRDVSEQNPQISSKIRARYRTWSQPLESPRWTDGHIANSRHERSAADAAGTRQYPMPWARQ